MGLNQTSKIYSSQKSMESCYVLFETNLDSGFNAHILAVSSLKLWTICDPEHWQISGNQIVHKFTFFAMSYLIFLDFFFINLKFLEYIEKVKDQTII